MRVWWLIFAFTTVIYGEQKSPQPAGNQQQVQSIKQPSTTPPRIVAAREQYAANQSGTIDSNAKSYLTELFSANNLPNILLFVAGLGGIGVGIFTLRQIREQTNLLAQYVEATKNGVEATRIAAEAARQSVETAQGQLAQMEASGRQTDQLIEQAKAQVKQLKDSTDIALASAENALVHTKVLIHAERPWVLIDQSVVIPPGAGAIRRGHIFFRAKNWGKNPARVTRYCCNWVFWEYGSELPEEPEYHQTELLYPKYLVPSDIIDVFDYDCGGTMTNEYWDDMNKKNQKLLFIGHIVYFDLATDQEHETRFCYAYTQYGTLIMQGPRTYNRQT